MEFAAEHIRFQLHGVFFIQSYHKWSTNFQRRMYGHETNVEVRPLNEAVAVQVAADFVGEGFIFSVCTSSYCLKQSNSTPVMKKLTLLHVDRSPGFCLYLSTDEVLDQRQGRRRVENRKFRSLAFCLNRSLS